MITELTYPFSLPPLPYSYDALEPYIDAETMHFHHDKHFQTYIDNLNTALKRLSGISVAHTDSAFDRT